MPFPRSELPSFAREDASILRSEHDVTVAPCRSITEMLALVVRAARSDVVFLWFGSLRYLPVAFAARLFGTKVLIVAGGYDVADEPSIGYGNMRGGVTRILGRLLFSLAHRVLPYSEAGAAETLKNARVPADRIELIHLALDPTALGEDVSAAEKEDIIVSIAIIDASTILRKGLRTLARASKLVPEAKFVIVGDAEGDAKRLLEREGGSNLELMGHVSDAERNALLRRAKVYAQPSVHEAFGYAVAEAMLFNCIPVVSNRGSLPEVTGPCGVFVSPDDPVQLAEALRRALRVQRQHPSPRRSIAERFSLNRRRDALLRAIRSAVGDVTSESLRSDSAVVQHA